MSDICPECNGQELVPDMDKAINGECCKSLYKPCPACKVRLEVECEGCGGIRCKLGRKDSEGWPMRPCAIGCKATHHCIQRQPCPTCKDGYRPMTPQEVNEIERYEYHLFMLHHGKEVCEVGKGWDSHYWNKVDNGEMYYKGQRVRVAR